MSKNFSIDEIFENFIETEKKCIEVCLKDIEKDSYFYSLFKNLALFYSGKYTDIARVRNIKYEIVEEILDRLNYRGWIDEENRKLFERYNNEQDQLFSSIEVKDIDRILLLGLGHMNKQFYWYNLGLREDGFLIFKLLRRYIVSRLNNYISDNTE